MQYSITPVLHPYADKSGLHKLNLQVIYNRKKAYAPASIKLKEEFWDNGVIVKHPNRKVFSDLLNKQRNEIEKRLIEAIRENASISKQRLGEIAKGQKEGKQILITDFIFDQVKLLKGRLTEGRLKHYKVMAGKIEYFKEGATFREISITWLGEFEAWLRSKGLHSNTVLSNMSLLVGIFNKAAVAGLIKKEQFAGYKRPRYTQKISEYLTEEEINKLFDLVKIIEKPGHKLAGYYYILSCLTGYRLSDAKSFDYKKNVQDGNLILQAKKNKAIVSTPIFSRLAEVLEYIKDKPLHLSEDKIRQYIKELFSLVGINKDISYHSSRHSYAMLLIKKGFSIDEVAQAIGDTAIVAKVYAKISNPHLHKKFKELLG